MKFTRMLLLTIVGYGLFCLVLFLIKSPAVTAILATQNLLPTDEPITELYFEHHELLPQHVILDEKIEASFAVVNKSTQQHAYSYTVTIIGPDGSYPLSQGSVRLKSQESRVILIGFQVDQEKLVQLGEKYMVQVVLSTGQEIHFWLTTQTETTNTI